MFKHIHMAGSCIEAIERDCHHKDCQYSGLQISNVDIAKEIPDCRYKENGEANTGNIQCSNQNLGHHFFADTLEQQPIDEDSAKVLILRLAAEQYAALGNEEYETNRLRRLFSAFECVAELNADLLKSTVSEVLVTRQNVKLR